MFYAGSDLFVASSDPGDLIVAPQVSERNDGMDEALWYLASLMFSALYSLVESSPLYTLRHEELRDLSEGTKYASKKVPVSTVVQEVSLRVLEALGVRVLGGTSTQMVECDENR